MTTLEIDGRRLATTLFIAVASNSVLTASRFALPIVALGFGASEFTVGVLSGLLMVVPLAIGIPFGRWMDRVGALTPMTVATLLSVLSGLVSMAYPGVASLALTSLLAGAGSMMCHITATQVMGGAGTGDSRMRLLGLLGVGYATMQFLAPLMIGFAYDGAGPRAAFAALAAPPVLALLALFFGRHLFVRKAAQPAGLGGVDRRLGALLREPVLRTWALVYAVFQSALSFYPVVSTLHGGELGFSASAISALFAAQAVGVIGSRAAVSMIDKSVSRRLIVGVALTMSALAFVVTPALHAWPVLLAVSFCVGVCTGIGQPVSMSMVYEAAPSGRLNESISLASITANFLQLVVPIVSGALASIYGVTAMAAIVAASLAFAAGLAVRHARG
ncbi:MAG: MFS transporter [Burkholderiales bacterium]|nr:MFS transporter [Burkholderiales bacterium]